MNLFKLDYSIKKLIGMMNIDLHIGYEGIEITFRCNDSGQIYVQCFGDWESAIGIVFKDEAIMNGDISIIGIEILPIEYDRREHTIYKQ